MKDLTVFRAEPAEAFDAAAIKALVSQWRYRPIVRDGRVVEQRARLRVRFALQEG